MNISENKKIKSMNINDDFVKEENNDDKELKIFDSFSKNIFKNLSEKDYNNLKCNYCDEIPLEPKVFKEENKNNQIIICANCYERLNKGDNFVKGKILEKETSSILKQIIGNYKVSCLQYDCDWEGKLSRLKKHMISECEYLSIKCPNKGCNLIILKKELKSHLINCVFDETILKINCNFCNIGIKKKEIEEHFEICPEMMVDCENNCGKKIKRKDLNNHKINCPENLEKCKFWAYGCRKIIKKKYMKDHENLEIKNHYNLIKNSSENIFEETNEYYKIVDIISELETEVKPYGINNALVVVRIKITAHIKVILPLVPKDIEIVNKIPISINIINGSIPEAYISTDR